MRMIFFMLAISFSLTACYEKKEGCLDLKASNFDIGADEGCADCCTYPKLKITFENKWQYPDTLFPFKTDTFFYDALNQPFRIERIRFYWSNFNLELTDGTQIGITDLVNLKVADGTDTISLQEQDHFLLADVNSATDKLTLGSIVPTGSVSQVNTTFGIPRPANSAFVSTFNASHPLAPKIGNMNYGPELGYVFAKIELYRDTIASDTIPTVVNIYGDNALRNLNLALTSPTTLLEGFAPELVVQTDFAQWFNGVNIRTSDTTSLQSQIVNNIASSFTLKAVNSN